MLVFEIKVRIKFLKPISFEKSYEKIGGFIDSALGLDSYYLQFHQDNYFKLYCVDSPYPIETDSVYKSDNIYTIRIRTVRQDLAEYFLKTLIHHKTDEIIGLGTDISIIPQKFIESVYNLTPIVIKTAGYWRGKIGVSEYEEKLRVNLIKKYNQFHNTKMNEDFELFKLIEFKNKVPVKVPYKNITFLGDKLNIVVAENKAAQNLVYMSLGTGIGELNSRSCGFLNYRFQ